MGPQLVKVVISQFYKRNSVCPYSLRLSSLLIFEVLDKALAVEGPLWRLAR